MTAHVKFDASRADGCYVSFERLIESDDCSDRPDERDDVFWPSRDPQAAGYVLPENYDSEHAKAVERMRAWDNGEWEYVGVRAQAIVEVIVNRVGTRYVLTSPGLWGIESDAGEYLDSVYEEECEGLLADLKRMGDPTVVQQ